MRLLVRAGIAGLAALVVLHGVLALDLAWRIWVMRRGFESGLDVALLITLEVVRAVVTLGLVGLAFGTARQRQPGHTALAVSLLFLAVAYANASAFAAFPGFFQEKLTIFLTTMGAPRPVLRVLFGSALWALTPAVALFLAFAIRYPVPADASNVRAVHATGRPGMLREVALAGLDVRSLIHRAAAYVLEAGYLGAVPLALFATTGVALAVTGSAAAAAVVLGACVAAFACALAFLRTSWIEHEGEHRGRLRLLAFAGAGVALQFVASGALSFLPGSAAARAALALAAAAPLFAFLFLARFALPSPPGSSQNTSGPDLGPGRSEARLHKA